MDSNHDGFVSRAELRAAMANWLRDGDSSGINQQQLTAALDHAFPESVLNSMLHTRGPQNETPKPSEVAAMEAALPDTAPAKPLRPRKVLVLCKAAGYVHESIPLAAKTVEELGDKTGAWRTAITYNSASINANNLKQYDLVFLDSTTGAFLDDPGHPSVTAARKKALLDFVRSGKGLAGIHAAADSYHEARQGAGGMGPMLAPAVMHAADTDHNGKLTAGELSQFSDQLFDRMDREKAGKIGDADVRSHLLFAMFRAGSHRGGAYHAPAKGRTGPDPQYGTWPAFNKMIGAYFKWHWTDPTHIVYKIDDPNSPLTAMFRGKQFSIDDETYTFSIHSFSRHNVHVLTSIDYSKMSAADKAKEDYPRSDHFYPLSWIHRAGKGRVFYMAHGHDARVYANKIMLEHLLAG
ncbi:MAG: ThuA domain-containing protein, partial [Bryobacteraceae bacterium]